jgi:hypothetical protein
MRMNKKTLEATHKAVVKWDKIERDTRAHDKGRDNCSLCDLFYDDCSECPVYKKTRRSFCKGTPHIAWTNHCADAHGNYYGGRKPRCKECMRLTRAMKAFIISLLPPKERVRWEK